jgi:hypothetical protein
MKVDMSPKAVTLRLKQVAQLRRVCLALAKNQRGLKIQKERGLNKSDGQDSLGVGR